MTCKEAGERLAGTGLNSLEKCEVSSPFGFFLNQLKCLMAFVLLTGIIISTFMHGWADVLIILTIILGNAILSLAMVAIHFVSAELTKRWYYRHVGNYG